MRILAVSTIGAVAIATLVTLTTPVQAQDTNTNRRAERRGPTVQQRLERLSEELNLTAEQKAKVSALLENQAKQRREIVRDTSLSRDERREKMRALMQGERKEFKAVLTSDQFEKFQQLREQMRARRSAGPGASGNDTAAPAPAPAPENKGPDTKKP